MLKVVLDVWKSVDPERALGACEALEIDSWGLFARDFNEVRYLWDAAGWAIELAPNHSDWHDLTRDAFIERTIELCSELPRDWGADELSEASDELELLMKDLEAELDNEMMKLRSRVERLRDAEEEKSEFSASLSDRYGHTKESDPASDIDGVFRTLVEQIER